jgi:hypothetical protein
MVLDILVVHKVLEHNFLGFGSPGDNPPEEQPCFVEQCRQIGQPSTGVKLARNEGRWNADAARGW